MKKNINVYEVDKLRSKLAKESKLKELKKTYSGIYPEIKNSNTPRLWDVRNLDSNDFTKSDDSQAQDKLHLISKNLTQPNMKVLNVGFGSANLEKLIYKTHKNIKMWEGIDISKKSVVHANKHFPRFSFKLGKVDDIKYQSGIFTHVIILEVLEHVSPSKILKSLSEMNRVLAVGGTLILSIPLNEDLEKMINEGVNFNQHVRIYTPELIKAELELSGFEVFKTTELISFKKHYKLKKFLVRYIFRGLRRSNGITVYAKKI